MFAPTRYLRWASRFFGKVPLDLATSGMKPRDAPPRNAGMPASLEDPAAWGMRFARGSPRTTPYRSTRSRRRSERRTPFGPRTPRCFPRR